MAICRVAIFVLLLHCFIPDRGEDADRDVHNDSGPSSADDSAGNLFDDQLRRKTDRVHRNGQTSRAGTQLHQQVSNL